LLPIYSVVGTNCDYSKIFYLKKIVIKHMELVLDSLFAGLVSIHMVSENDTPSVTMMPQYFLGLPIKK
jgi:hypothetical protein